MNNNEIFEIKRASGGFTLIPDAVFDMNLDADTKIVYVALCRISQDQSINGSDFDVADFLIKQCSINKEKLKSCTKNLEKANMIQFTETGTSLNSVDEWVR